MRLKEINRDIVIEKEREKEKTERSLHLKVMIGAGVTAMAEERNQSFFVHSTYCAINFELVLVKFCDFCLFELQNIFTVKISPEDDNRIF